MIDIHTHIIPGIDDGAHSMEEAMEILKEEKLQGVDQVICTPHYRREMFEPEPAQVFTTYHALKERAEKELSMKLYLGCEFHANMDMVDTFLAGERPTMAESPYVLVEFYYQSPAIFIKERCYALSRAGFRPVIAHAERYDVIRKNNNLLEELVDSGVLVQVNCDSILGREGFMTKRWCLQAIRKDLVHFVASDVHNLSGRPCRMAACRKYLSRKCGEDVAYRLTEGNVKETILLDR